jgi:hypothetical protein
MVVLLLDNIQEEIYLAPGWKLSITTGNVDVVHPLPAGILPIPINSVLGLTPKIDNGFDKQLILQIRKCLLVGCSTTIDLLGDNLMQIVNRDSPFIPRHSRL